MKILEWLGFKRRSRFDIALNQALRAFETKHADNLECLVCKALKAGADPRRIRIVQEYDPVLKLKINYIDEKGHGVWVQ